MQIRDLRKKSERLPFRSNRFHGFRVYNHLVTNPINIPSVK